MSLRFRWLITALCGAVYGLALARWLFEAWPVTFSVFSTWPGVGVMALVCAALTAFVLQRLDTQPYACLALLLPLISLLAPDVNLIRAQTLLFGALALLVVLMMQTLRVWPLIPPCLLFLFLLTLYLLTLAPVVGEADPFEFQVNVARLGISHGNGYPLLTLVGKIFEALPLGGTPAWRVNLSAAVAMAAAGVGVMTLAQRLGASTLTAFLAGLAFGVAPSVWARAVEIEAYALNAALMTVLLHLGLTLLEAVRDKGQGTTGRSARWLYALAFVFGLSLTNHLTSLMLAPALVLAALAWLWSSRRNPPHVARFTVYALLFFLLGLAIYLYIPLRWPAINNGEVLSLQQFGYFLRGGEAAGQFEAWLPLKEPQRFEYVWRKITGEFGWVGFGLMMVGIVAMMSRAERERRETGGAVFPIALFSLAFLLLAYLGHTYFVLAYDPPEPDFSDFFVSPYVIAAIWMAMGLQALSHRLSVIGMPRSLVPAAFCLLPLALIWNALPRFDYAAAHARHDLGRYTLSQPLAQNAALLADPKRYAAPYYLQQAEGVRPDLDIVVLPDEASYRAALDERIAAGQTVYLARYLAGLGSGYSLRSVGPLAEVAPQPFTTRPSPQYPLALTLTDGVQLIGLDRYHLNETLYLTLHWHVTATPSQTLAVYLRLHDAQATTVWRNTGAIPVSGLYPTNAWRAGEYISDFYAIPLTGLAPTTYQMQVGLFPLFQPGPDSAWETVSAIVVPPNEGVATLVRPLRAQFGAQWLMGYDAPEVALPDSPVEVTLYWLRGESESVTAFGETRSVTGWPVGAIVPMRYALRTPASGETFVPRVATGEPARCGWLAGESVDCALPPIPLTGASIPTEAINFNGQLVLRTATLETPQVTRGESVRVTLEWQALQRMRESYTVFVHLIGPDGKLYGQVDYWPVEGTRLTTSWLPGEIIRDPYAVTLPADAPPGEYTVHIGLYLLDTLERLPVLNADSQPMDDKTLLGPLTVR